MESDLMRGYIVRGTTIITGGISSIFLTNEIIATGGNKIFALFVIMTSLPALMPFLDFGLGTGIYNHFVDRREKEILTSTEAAIVSIVFFLITGAVIILFILLFSVVAFTKIKLLNIPYWDGNSNLYLLLIAGITLAAAPFSIGAKKLHAQSSSYKVWLVEGTVPVFNFLIIAIWLKISGRFEPLMVLIPSCAYFTSTIGIFYIAELHKKIIRPKLEDLKSYALPAIKLGFWSVILTTCIALIWQIPKYFFSFSGNASSVAQYGIMSMILLPAFSLLNVSSTWLAPMARLSNGDELSKLLVSNFRKAFLRSIGIGILILIGVHVLKFLHLPSPSLAETLVIVWVIAISTTWIIPFTAFSNQGDIRWLSVRVVPVLILSIIILILTESIAVYESLFIYFSTIIAMFSSLAWIHFRRKQK